VHSAVASSFAELHEVLIKSKQMQHKVNPFAANFQSERSSARKQNRSIFKNPNNV